MTKDKGALSSLNQALEELNDAVSETVGRLKAMLKRLEEAKGDKKSGDGKSGQKQP